MIITYIINIDDTLKLTQDQGHKVNYKHEIMSEKTVSRTLRKGDLTYIFLNN